MGAHLFASKRIITGHIDRILRSAESGPQSAVLDRALVRALRVRGCPRAGPREAAARGSAGGQSVSSPVK